MCQINHKNNEYWYNELDWDDITKRLLFYVAKHWSSLPWEILQGGHHPEDLVQQVIMKTFDDVRHKPDGVSPFQFFIGAIRSEISNLLTNKENASTERYGQNSRNKKELDIAQIARALNEVEQESLAREYAEEREKILKEVANDELLHAVVETILDDDIYTPRAIARILGVTERDIYNAKKRGQRRLQSFVHRVEET